MNEQQARVEVGPDGQLILIDPTFAAVVKAIAKHNCKNTLEANADRIAHFRNRVVELGRSPKDTVIVIANVDDKAGGILAESCIVTGKQPGKASTTSTRTTPNHSSKD